MNRLLRCIGIIVLTTGCHSLTGPSDRERITSSLGFELMADDEYRATGGRPTQIQADLSDQYWRELMILMGKVGMKNTDPTNTRNASIVLHFPYIPEDSSLIKKPADPNGYYRGWYTNIGYSNLRHGFIHVSGEFLNFRRPDKILKHEFLHHFCQMTLGKSCKKEDGGPDNAANHYNHIWIVNGVNIWSLVD